jgi:hypothetical protein
MIASVTEEEALRHLGLEAGATRSEIQAAFRRRAKAAHPDSSGSDVDMSRLNEAKDVALGIAERAELIPISAVNELIRSQERSMIRVEGRAERRERAQRAVQNLVRHETNRVTRRKREAQAVGWLAGGATVVTGLLRAVVLTDPSNRGLFAILIIVFAVLGAVLGVIVWLMNFRVTQVQQLVEDASETLSERGAYFAILHEIETASDATLPLLDDEFRRAIGLWIDRLGYDSPGTVAALARRVGPDEFSRLLTAKGAELEVLGGARSRRGGTAES